MALKMAPAEALLASMARIPESSKLPDDVRAEVEAAARALASADEACVIYTLLADGPASWAKPPPARHM